LAGQTACGGAAHPIGHEGEGAVWSEGEDVVMRGGVVTGLVRSRAAL
jgi:hypothetical protein